MSRACAELRLSLAFWLVVWLALEGVKVKLHKFLTQTTDGGELSVLSFTLYPMRNILWNQLLWMKLQTKAGLHTTAKRDIFADINELYANTSKGITCALYGSNKSHSKHFTKACVLVYVRQQNQIRN